MKIYNNPNVLISPLKGICLIESSAGTGKTHTFITLYLRLLLGLNSTSTNFSRPLKVEEILVITFKKASIEEFRASIYEYIHKLRLACCQGKSENALFSAFLGQLNDHQLASLYLLRAEQEMDKASIFTIHGFCRHVLAFNVIKSDILFQQSIIKDESKLYHQASADFWRRHCYSLPLEVAKIIRQHWKGPENLLADLLPYLYREPTPTILVDDSKEFSMSFLAQHTHIIANINTLKKKWLSISSNLLKILSCYNLDPHVYNRKNILSWIDKIDFWANQPTIDYCAPVELKQFTIFVLEKTITNQNSSFHALCNSIETFYHYRSSLRNLFFLKALKEIRQSVQQEKHCQGEIGFNDLLSYFDQIIERDNGKLAKSIRLQYPMAIIDEFQDIDLRQQRIFFRIYKNKSNCVLLLIGDPKQAIYTFQGKANIFAYINARVEVNTCYTFDTNWRSSSGMVNAVNQLFQNLYNPFIFNKIQFSPMKVHKNNIFLRLIIQGKPQPALRMWLQPGKGVNINEYQYYMARLCATTIHEWLFASHNEKAWLENYCQGSQRRLTASDITILVRNREEACIVRAALSELMIPTVYLSNQENIFCTSEAHELLWILQAILAPEKDNTLRTALSTKLLGLNALDIDALNSNEQCLAQQIEKFMNYRFLWKKDGIFSMLRQIMIDYCIAENLLVNQNGEHRLTNILHLGELLQESSFHLKNEDSLVKWLISQIETPSVQEETQCIRLENDRPMVQIITIHKSKGLEFPIVFLPFAASFRIQKQPLFHDRKTFLVWLDLCKKKENMQLAEEERLAEDLRLLYVAITRSVYHCSLGIAPLYRGNRKKVGASDLHLSALGYLIQQGHKGNSEYLHAQLLALEKRSGGDISLCKEAQKIKKSYFSLFSLSKQTPVLQARQCLIKFPRDSWKITGYSELQRYNHQSLMTKLQSSMSSAANLIDGENKGEKKTYEMPQLTIHSFPRGTETGIFLHRVLEIIDFKKPINKKQLKKELIQHDIDTVWMPVIADWIEKIVAMRLNKNNTLSLTNIDANSSCTELEFHLSIDSLVQAHNIDSLCRHYDPLSAKSPPLHFPQIKGILKGVIDLVFRWQGRYYLLDYKSNWLGNGNAAYTRTAIEKTMIFHRYDLQYQLYTLAVHRYLRSRLSDYFYSRDFGGIYYFFLRGAETAELERSIFYYRPNKNLIDKLDDLFIKKNDSKK
ncbi:exodeoxyribonuclease V subunit beta [Sodalis sp. CWE]|uniref:exodeoxyribonuclease V subunit beta n=1 Tax=Sodalis sp. CWE TaxID=2803816 RepID=UPI002105458B|nr:exodeoxyribonuclease V subunit beta [Sodalis sp. CWE]